MAAPKDFDMTSRTFEPPRRTDQRTLAVKLAEVLPNQGEWSEEQYLWLTDYTHHMIELSDGWLEVLPMPTDRHQTILSYLNDVFRSFLTPLGGKVLFAALRVRILPGHFREPDLVVLLSADDPRRQDRFWLGADLVVEVVSPDDPRRDTVEKREEYAAAGILEYWIVNPMTDSITVLALRDGVYVEHGVFGRGVVATSVLVTGLAVDVDATFDAK